MLLKRNLVISSYYSKYPPHLHRAKIYVIVPLIWRRTNATVWDLLISCRYLCPARMGSCIAKEIWVAFSCGLAVKDPVLSLQQLASLVRCGFDPWHGCFHTPWAWPKKKKREREREMCKRAGVLGHEGCKDPRGRFGSIVGM